MASLFKKKRTEVISGRRVKKQSLAWYTRLNDVDGVRRTIRLFRDKTASEQRATQLQTEIERAMAGYVDCYKEHRKRPLAEHLEDYQQALLDRGTTKGHATLTYNRVESIFTACKFVFIQDVRASRVQNHIAERKLAGLGTKSCNHYLVAIKSFFNWLINDQRMGENPLAHLRGQNARKDVRRRRRALALEEIDALLTATLAGAKHHTLTGRERYMLYTLALSTGFRAGELYSLSWRLLNLSESEPSVIILADHAKNGQEDTLPLREDIAGLFRKWLAENNFSPDDKVFPRFNKAKGAAMLREDLQAAGIDYENEAGFADFHSLRHSFISNVGRSGATVKEAQKLARHSTSALTLDVYTHIGLNDERRAIENLPELHRTGQKNQAVALKTGTDDRPVGHTQNRQEIIDTKIDTKNVQEGFLWM